ncbi:MAG: efflux RND transporter periplasmic adaptor subunit [Clostridia bacterium]|nr:efflux RND transporter periplasmic adaptor subunit [Clostridia bacterium]
MNFLQNLKKSVSSTVMSLWGKFGNLSKKKKIAILISVILILVLLGSLVFGGKNDEKQQNYIEAVAKIGNITETIEQSGVVEPYERYEITSLVKGEIISSPFEEGDLVEEGDTLYQIDDEDAQLNMEKAQMSLEESNENVNSLNIYAPASGNLTDFSIKTGDNVGASTIGKIINTDKLNIDIPFSLSDYNKISVGDRVSATSSLYMTTISGTVTHKYTANSNISEAGSVVRNIEIELKNPGALATGTTFAATVHTRSGDVNSAGSGIIEDGTTTDIRAEVSGEVYYVGVKNGDYVQKGQLIVCLKNNSLLNAYKTNQLNVRSNQKTLDNYNITSPIAGTVITKNSKVGDKIDNSNSQTVMMVVADMSKMKFTITVDELDIADIKLGQIAIVDADAIPDSTFEARVTSIASEGVSSGDGVTTFTVELTIDEPGELKSGMNVNANILISEAYDVLTIPEEALMSVRGNSATVLTKSNREAKKNQKETKEMPEEKSEEVAPGNDTNRSKQWNESGDMPQMPEGNKNPSIPDGYEIRRITIGISDGRNVEVLDGLSDGETVLYIPSAAGSGQMGFPAMMMGGGMMSGGMPHGSMTGGNRSGMSGTR